MDSGHSERPGRRAALRGMAGIGVSAVAASVVGACVGARPSAQAQDPGPLPSGEALNANVMVGKTLRVYHTGDVVTLDFSPDRVNVELGPDDRIVAVTLG
ncbi:MAG: I78 family peptidase inhibitor [Alphaproteobacteria bacterium]